MWKPLTLTTMLLMIGASLVGWSHAARPDGAGVRRFPAAGLVVGMVDARLVQVAHDDIPGYMPGMTMAFGLGPKESAAPAPGDRIQFTLCVGPDAAWMEGVRVTGRSVPSAETARPRATVDRLRRGDLLPAVTLVDEHGRTLRTADLRGHATVLTFIFTRCPVPEFCPLVSRRFTQLQAALAAEGSAARETRLLSVTLDPAFDTPEVLAAYGAAVGASPDRWRFATGEPGAVMRVARAFSVYVEKNGALLDHTLATALVDRDGRIVEIWRGNGWKLDEVTAALRAAAADRTD